MVEEQEKNRFINVRYQTKEINFNQQVLWLVGVLQRFLWLCPHFLGKHTVPLLMSARVEGQAERVSVRVSLT